MDHETRDLNLDEVLIGGREMREIVIVDYDASWPAPFEAERTRVQQALGVRALCIEQIGSTAVTGLAAEPIIDLLATMKNPEDDSSIAAAMKSEGYELRVREAGHRMFARLGTTSTCTSGEMQTPKSRAACAFATGFVIALRIVKPTSYSNDSWQDATGAT